MIEAGYSAACAMGQPDLRAFNLTVSSLSAELSDDFDDLGGTCRADRMPFRQ